MEKETLEEVAEKYANNWEEMHPELDFEDMTPIEISKIDFIEGAKWQQERSYSEEDMDNYAEYCTTHVLTTQIGNPYLSIKEFFEQFKNK